jgi:hypothetical protein
VRPVTIMSPVWVVREDAYVSERRSTFGDWCIFEGHVGGPSRNRVATLFLVFTINQELRLFSTRHEGTDSSLQHTMLFTQGSWRLEPEFRRHRTSIVGALELTIGFEHTFAPHRCPYLRGKTIFNRRNLAKPHAHAPPIYSNYA